MDKIDFVLLWVDGSDSEWLKEKNKYKKENKEDCNRYRDWGILKYWFRGVEKYAPWVNKIHFITWGHVPSWLDVDNPKVNVVKHSDYIPEEFLPTFNSNVIELNLHRLKDLEENFVLFNDDMFLCKNVEKEVFFKNDLPCLSCIENINMPYEYNNSFSHTMLNNIGIINKYFSKRKFLKNNLNKYFNIKYGIDNLRNLCLLPWPKFAQFRDPHMPVPIKKSTLSKIWEEEEEALKNTSYNKFRENTDVSQYLVRYWQILTGKFVPINSHIGAFFEIDENNTEMLKVIENQKKKIVCLNDSNVNIDFESKKKEIVKVFEQILPQKSCFEKGEE